MTRGQGDKEQGSRGAGEHSPFSILHSYMRRWGLRLRAAESLTWGPWGAAAGLGLGLALALAARLWPLLAARWLAGLAALLTLAGVMVGLMIVWVRPRPLAALARVFDRRFGLAERLTTALEIDSGHLRATQAMARAQLADTLDAARGIDPGTLLPLRAPRRALAALGVLAAALALLLWLPNPQEVVLLQRAAMRAAVEEQIEELGVARQEVAGAEGLTEADREALLGALEEATRALDEGRATPEEAVAALSEAEQALAALQDHEAAGVRAGLEQAAGEMADSELTRDIAEALTLGDYRQAARALAAYSGTKGQVLTRAEELELARELAQAAKALAESNPTLAEQLAQAAEAIEHGDVAEARQVIQEAAREIGQAGERVQRQETVEHTLSQLQEGREQIAQASGTQPGAGQIAQQGGSQSGQPGGEQPGVGQQTQPGGEQPGAGQQTQPGHHEDAGTGAPYDQVYVPYRLDEQGQRVDVGRQGEGGEPTGDKPLPPPLPPYRGDGGGGTASVPYRDVYAGYAAQAGAALEGSYIPLGLKQYVRDYFSSLEP